MIGEINTKPQAGEIDIQGIINQYEVQSGGNISAGDFVEFINNWNNFEKGTATQIDTVPYCDDKPIDGILIENNKVFIAYFKKVSSKYYIYGMVCTINNNGITLGTATQIVQTYNSSVYARLGLCKIENNKVFIYYVSKSSSSSSSGIICTINGTTINIGTEVSIGKEHSPRPVLIDSNKILYTSSSASLGKFYGIVCTISGTTITKGTEAVISSDYYGSCASVLIENNKVFISVGGRGLVCTINGTTITIGTFTNYMFYYHSSGTRNYASLIDNNKIFCIAKPTTNLDLNGIVCTINGTTITAGTATVINSNKSSASALTILTVGTNKVFITHLSNDTNKYLNGIFCIVQGDTINIGTDNNIISEKIFETNASSCLISDNKILTLYAVDNNKILYGVLLSPSKKTIGIITTSSQKIGGVAQEDGSGGDTIDVIEPYTS